MAGSYEKRGNSYRLVYMLDGKKHTKTVRSKISAKNYTRV